MRIAVGTRKGIWLADDAGTGEWSVTGPFLTDAEIASVAWDGDTVLAGAMSWFWGPSLRLSSDGGQTWDEGKIGFAEDAGASLARVWHLHVPEPGVVWAGGEPHSLWRSDDGGRTFALNTGLWEHPHRTEWGPGQGGPAVHTILTLPEGAMAIAMSAGGVYRSPDGEQWSPANRGIATPFLPGEPPEYGQCVHRIAVDADDPKRMYAQNHGGVYRTDDGGDQWVSIADGLPSDFGFVCLAHPTTGGVAWVLPLDGEAGRVPPGGRLLLWRTDDAGATWEPTAGLPEDAWAAVLRDAASVAAQPDGTACVAFGTRDGCVYASTDDGRTFTEIARHLPDVLSVKVAP